MFESVSISPVENIKTRTPVNIIPLLNRTAEMPSMPRSLKACCVHLNQGDCKRARPMNTKNTIGSDIPQIPAIFGMLDLAWDDRCIYIVSDFIII